MLKHILKVGPALIITAATLWALDGVVRRSLFSLPPIIIVFYEHLIGAVILIPFIWKKLISVRLSRRELILLTIIALLSGVLGTLWFTTALLKVNFIPFSVVFLLQKLQPVFAITSAIIFLKEPLKKNYLYWAALALFAAYFVTFPGGLVNFETGSGTVTAALFALGAAFAWGTSTTFSKMALTKYDSNLITGLRFIFTTVISLPFVFFLNAGSQILAPDFSQFLKFTFIAVSTGMVALLIYYRGLKETPVRVATILELVFPVLAIVIDAVLYKTFLAPTQLLAAAVLIFSIWRLSSLQLKHEI
jgi:drug/metabolite transporter (DMT)-like permease